MHYFVLSGTLLLAALANLSYAAPSLNGTSNKGIDSQWGKFCSDTECSDDCGEYVDMSNGGCLNWDGAGSFYVKDGSAAGFMLIASKDADCPCQTDCVEPDGGSSLAGGWTTGCHKLPSGMSSWRWVRDEDGCPDNQCT